MVGFIACYTLPFLLTHLMRGATSEIGRSEIGRSVSTHAPHARCDSVRSRKAKNERVSTHAPHARCDKSREFKIENQDSFYSRTSCEVRRF